VLGFELSRSVQGQPGARPHASGTPGYQAPEQIKPTEELDGRADVWALGVVLYQCIAGRHPFQADSVSLMQQAAANDSPRPMDPGIPRPLQAVVLRCLEKHRDARFPSIADLAAALAPFAHDQRAAAVIVDRASFMSHGLGGGYEVAPHGQYPIIAPPTVPAGYAPSRSRRRYATIGLGVLAVSLSGIAAAALIVPGRTGSTDKSPAPAATSLTPSNTPASAGPAAPGAAAGPAAAGPAASPAIAASTPSSVANRDSAADPSAPPTPTAAGTSTPSAAPSSTVKTADEPASNASPPNSATTGGRPATDSAATTGRRPATDSAVRSSGSSTSTGRAKTERATTERATTERASTERAGTERAGTERAPAAPSPSPRGKRGESCDSMDVDELMTRAAIQYDAGSATSALSFTRVALGCKQTDRMYWLAVMYACAAGDVANARLYFPKVPSNLQSGLEAKCQRENLDVRSRKGD
jgi:hypothetical protein